MNLNRLTDCSDSEDEPEFSIKKKLKVKDNKLEILLKSKPLCKKSELFKGKTLCKNIELFVDGCNSINGSNQNDNNINETDKSLTIIKQNLNEKRSVNVKESKITVKKHHGVIWEPISYNEIDNDKKYANEINKKLQCTTNSNQSTSINLTKNNIGSTSKDLNKSTKIDNDEIDYLLDKAYNEKINNSNINTYKTFTKEKTVLEDNNTNNFDILPENWIQTTDNSGLPIYLHEPSRVVTLSKPYFLGSDDLESHVIPFSASSHLPDTAEENNIKESLAHEELRKYCVDNKFKVLLSENSYIPATTSENCIKYKHIVDKVSLTDSDTLKPSSVQFEDRHQEWIIKPSEESPITNLDIYLQRSLKTQPQYEYTEISNKETPYSATVILKDIKYGVGLGNSKITASINAAQATLNILMIGTNNKIVELNRKDNQDLLIFDQIKVTDPRIPDLCVKIAEHSPYDILLKCLQRNFGKCEVNIKYGHIESHKSLDTCVMAVPRQTVSVSCRNKQDGKQKASQLVLSNLHPYIDNWGSLFRLYGCRRIETAFKTKQEYNKINQLQRKATMIIPNYSLLNKLKEEMLKVREEQTLKDSSSSKLETKLHYTIIITTLKFKPCYK